MMNSNIKSREHKLTSEKLKSKFSFKNVSIKLFFGGDWSFYSNFIISSFLNMDYFINESMLKNTPP